LYELYCFIRLTSNLREDSFDSLKVDEAGLVLVKDVKNCSEIFDLLLGVDFKNVKLAIIGLGLFILVFLIIFLLLFSVAIVGEIDCCDIDVGRFIHGFWDLRWLHLLTILLILFVYDFFFITFNLFLILFVSGRSFILVIILSSVFLFTFVLAVAFILHLVRLDLLVVILITLQLELLLLSVSFVFSVHI